MIAYLHQPVYMYCTSNVCIQSAANVPAETGLVEHCSHTHQSMPASDFGERTTTSTQCVDLMVMYYTHGPLYQQQWSIILLSIKLTFIYRCSRLQSFAVLSLPPPSTSLFRSLNTPISSLFLPPFAHGYLCYINWMRFKEIEQAILREHVAFMYNSSLISITLKRCVLQMALKTKKRDDVNK